MPEPRCYHLIEVTKRDCVPMQIAEYFDLDSALDERDRRRRESDPRLFFYGVMDADDGERWLDWDAPELEEAVA